MATQQLFQTINDIIKAEFKVTFNGGNIVLKDSNEQKPVKINKTGRFLCLSLDKSKSKNKVDIFPFFEKSDKVCKIPDNIIIYPTISSTLYVFIIELKSNSLNTTKARDQIRAGYLLSKYICETAQRILNNTPVEIQYRGLIFSNRLTTKGTTKPKNLHYTTDSNSNLQFKHLQSGYPIDLDTLTF